MTEAEALKIFKDGLLIENKIPLIAPAYEVAINALEKQIAKKPKYLPLKEGITLTNYECPICGCRRLGHGIDIDKCYCPECGQKLDWSVSEDE